MESVKVWMKMNRFRINPKAKGSKAIFNFVFQIYFYASSPDFDSQIMQ